MTSRVLTAVAVSLISFGCATSGREARGPDVTLDRYLAPVSSAVVSRVPPCHSLEKCGPAPAGTEWRCARRSCWLAPQAPPATPPSAVAEAPHDEVPAAPVTAPSEPAPATPAKPADQSDPYPNAAPDAPAPRPESMTRSADSAPEAEEIRPL